MSNNIKKPLLNSAAKAAVNNAATAATTVAKNAPASQPNKTVIILVLVGIGFLALLGLIGFIMQQTSNGRVNRLDKKITAQEVEIKDLNAKIKSAGSVSATNMKRGDQGPPGIQGPPGPTGGVHAGAGPLLCVGQKKVATPTVGTSQYSIIYLDDRRYTPIQYWTLRNNPDGTVSVVNKFTGNCMTTNNLGDVFSDTCRTPVPLTQKFNWGPNMQLSSADKQNFCVTVDNFDMNTSNSNNKYDLNNMTEKKNSNSGSVNQLKLKSCSQSQNLDQTWWIGN
jgi:hypothetical protein